MIHLACQKKRGCLFLNGAQRSNGQSWCMFHHFPIKLTILGQLGIRFLFSTSTALQLHQTAWRVDPVLIRPIQSVYKPGRCRCSLVRKLGLCSVAMNWDTRGAVLHTHLQLLAAQLTLEEPTLYMYGQDLYLGTAKRPSSLHARIVEKKWREYTCCTLVERNHWKASHPSGNSRHPQKEPFPPPITSRCNHPFRWI